ncbi:hypothetical protein NADFUDRAFT_72170 [Nadsonia fulvescens var. elongata DSM 6958]|uniref:Myb-like domain-containing protein n=1 Tax=Nadsonia fulvescens var. elongata DSM 6958 TaxID=857566 RepID=A0A1E3PDE4_9ASCO|nr:hypothetical protein NADFUDRAFT_72170 [Nadsonia fulvescens var. elongata DSM 6958]
MLMKDRQRRSRSPTNHDKVIIDVESVTMAQLCGDLHIGKLSDNHSLVMTAREKRMKRKLQDKLTRDSRASSVSSREGSPAIALENIVEKGKNDESFGSDDEKKDAKAMMNEELIKNTPINVPSRQSGTLQLRMIDGRIEINADSLHVNRSEGAMEIASATDKNVEEIMRFDKYVNSASYSKRERPERWDNDETSKFYKVLSQWGTDFNLIAQMFPYRNRRQIKSKFKLEEKKNPLKVHLALVRKLPVDIDTYEAAGGGKIMDDPHDIEVEIEKIRTEHEEWLTKEKESIAEARKADSAAALKSEQAMFNMGPPKRQSKSERLRLLRANQTIIGTVGEVKRELHEVAF